MRVSPLTQSYAPKRQAFKAIVKVDDTIPDNFPSHGVDAMRESLEHAKTAYRDWGNDNMLIRINPYVAYWQSPDVRTYGFEVTREFVDKEKARTDLIENNKKDFPEDIETISLLEQRDPEAMRNLERQELYPISLKNKKPCEYKKELDESINSSIFSLKYSIPIDPKSFKTSSSYQEPFIW